MQTNDQLKEALKLLNSAKQQDFEQKLIEQIDDVVSEIQRNHATVESAVALTDVEKQTLEKRLESLLARKLTHSYRVVPQILGGFRVSVGDWKLDATLTHQLQLMQTILGGRHG